MHFFLYFTKTNNLSDLHIPEVVVRQSLLGTYSCIWVQLKHPLQEVDPLLGYLWEKLFEILLFPTRKRTLEIRQFFNPRPHLGTRSAKNRENLEDLFYFIPISEEEGFFRETFNEDTPDCPYVH